jgi:hypothetical protein
MNCLLRLDWQAARLPNGPALRASENRTPADLIGARHYDRLISVQDLNRPTARRALSERIAILMPAQDSVVDLNDRRYV